MHPTVVAGKTRFARRLWICNCACLVCAALLGVLGATIVQFYKVDPKAAYLLLPYLGWSTFAAALTINIYINNPEANLICCSDACMLP